VEKKITGNYANSNLVQDMHLSLLPIFLPITIILVNWWSCYELVPLLSCR